MGELAGVNRVRIGTNIYHATSHDGMPAIRKLDHKGDTSRWLSLDSDISREVMEVLGLSPAHEVGTVDLLKNGLTPKERD